MAIALADLLDTRHVKLGLRSRTAETAIRELVAALAASEHLSEPDKFAEQVIAREQSNPSMVESGVVFPHARTDLVEKIQLAIGRKASGVPFGSNGARANFIFLIGVPQRLVSDYLVAVGALARIARNDVVRRELLRATTPEAFLEILRSASSPEGA
jgi:mannitol/fructose-specific phosphotransferase system IIA component (Ntr-type)